SNLRSSLKSRPESVRTSLLLARAHEINGSLELAEDRYAAAYRFSKYSPQIGIAYAQFFLRHDELKRANDVLEKILDGSPNNVSALKMMANIKLSEQNWAAAEDLAEKIRKIDEKDTVALQITGAALAGLQNSSESESTFEKAYEETPKAGTAMANLVKSYMQNGKIEKAESFLNSVLATSKDNYQAKVFLAQINFTKGKADDAIKLLNEAVSEHPKLSPGYIMLAKYYAGTKQVPEAENILKAGLKEEPEDFNLNISLAALYEGAGKLAEAKAIYKDMLKTRPNSEIVVNNLASLIAEDPKDEDELRYAYSLAKRFRSSKVPFFKDTLGWVHYRLGEYDAAIPLLQDAVLDVPDMPVLRYHLGMTFKASGNNDDAKTELERAISLAVKHPFPQEDEAKKALNELNASEPKTQ
ncbi:MAG: tetratricopeptide repeat protein, partial [Alphaproteobacteria bacterium]